MKFIIITGLSGAGKSQAMMGLEDLGFYCVDNIPPSLIVKFAELIFETQNTMTKVALSIDIRGIEFFDQIYQSLDELKRLNYKYEILFLDCQENELVRRYKMTRRNHPLAKNSNILDGLKREAQLLKGLKDRADLIINTSKMKPKELKEEINQIFCQEEFTSNIMISVISFGFKHGIPIDADLVFDVRFLPNPYYEEALRQKTGDDKEVRDYVMNSKVSEVFYEKFKDFIDFLIPEYIKEGKNHLVIAIGCTGGRHRSVTLVNFMYEHLKHNNYRLIKRHRDINLD